MSSKKQPLPAHLRNKLNQQGHLIDGATHKPRPGRCPHCRNPVLTALEGPAPTPTRINTQPLTALGEALALLHGTNTYRYAANEINKRTADQIAYQNADTIDVRAEHECGQHYETRPPPNVYPYPPWRPGTPIPECPF